MTTAEQRQWEAEEQTSRVREETERYSRQQRIHRHKNG